MDVAVAVAHQSTRPTGAFGDDLSARLAPSAWNAEKIFVQTAETI